VHRKTLNHYPPINEMKVMRDFIQEATMANLKNMTYNITYNTYDKLILLFKKLLVLFMNIYQISLCMMILLLFVV